MKTYTSRERTLAFINNQPVDRVPFLPIIMRWAAAQTNTNYRDFCLDYKSKGAAVLQCARDFDIDWLTVMSDPYAEAEAFGIQVEYPDNALPLARGNHLSLDDVRELKPYKVDDCARLKNRIDEIKEFKRLSGADYFVVGWVEGPMGEYADIRGVSNAAMDLFDDPDTVCRAMDVIVESALPFIKMQVEAGADCIGIGDAFASQIGPSLYKEFVFEREKRLVDYVHSLGALAKLHICGNTSDILPDMIATGADIIDIDHLVPSMAEFSALLGPCQVFSGKSDPVAIIQNGDPEAIKESVRACSKQANGRCIVSAGCEVPPDTPPENMKAFSAAASLAFAGR